MPYSFGPGAKSPAGSQSTCLPAPAATQALTASAALPAAGAYEAVPAQGAMVAVPPGSRRATIRVKYTRGAAGGQAAHKVYVSDGTNPMQAMAPDGTYAGIYGAPSTSASAIYYAISIDLIGGETSISQAGAEVGVTGTPGTVETAVTFG